MFGQCFKCLREELADKGGEIIEKADVPYEYDDEAEENVPAGTMRQLGDPLPELPKAKGENTRSVLFVTDKFLQKIVKEKGSSLLDQVKVLEWKPGTDLHLPKENRPAGPYRLGL